MTEVKKYWIADPGGVKALVDGVEARNYWMQVQGWAETTEPVGQEFQWVQHAEHGGRGQMNHEAALLHEELGWLPSDPPAPVSPMQTSAPDAPAEPVAPKPTAPPKPAASATSGDKKE